MHRNNVMNIAIIATLLALASCGGGDDQTASLGTVEGKATLSSGGLTRTMAFSMDLSAASKSVAAKADESPTVITGSMVMTGGSEPFTLELTGTYYASSGAFELHGQGLLATKTISGSLAGLYDGAAFSGMAASVALLDPSAGEGDMTLYTGSSIEVASSGTVETLSAGSGSVASSETTALYPFFYGTWRGTKFYAMDADGNTSDPTECASYVTLRSDGTLTAWVQGDASETGYEVEEIEAPSFEAWPDDTGAMIPCVNQRIYYKDAAERHYSARFKLQGGSEADGWTYLMIYPKSDDTTGSTVFDSLESAKAATGTTGRYKTQRVSIADIDKDTGLLNVALLNKFAAADGTTISFSASGSAASCIYNGQSCQVTYIHEPNVSSATDDNGTPFSATKQTLVFQNKDWTYSKLSIKVKTYSDGSMAYSLCAYSDENSNTSFSTIDVARAATTLCKTFSLAVS